MCTYTYRFTYVRTCPCGTDCNFNAKVMKIGGYINERVRQVCSKMVHMGLVGSPFCEAVTF